MGAVLSRSLPAPRVGMSEPPACVPDASLPALTAHSYGIGAAACAYMGMTAALVKMGQLEGWKVFAEPKV